MALPAEVSLADILERSKLGMAIAAMIRMIATTISSSMREKPFCLLRIARYPLYVPPWHRETVFCSTVKAGVLRRQQGLDCAPPSPRMQALAPAKKAAGQP